jgi:hypothetical protein
MTIKQVKDYFIDKNDVPCPMTEKLVKAGYQQISGGYIDRARREGLLVDYTKFSPSQYWHLMSYCNSCNSDRSFSKRIVCGELLFWMAEVSTSVPVDSLAMMVETIAQNAIGYDGERPIYDRRHWNKEIQRLCFDAIKATVENYKI